MKKTKKSRKIEFDRKIGKRKIARKRNGESMKNRNRKMEKERKSIRDRKKNVSLCLQCINEHRTTGDDSRLKTSPFR